MKNLISDLAYSITSRLPKARRKRAARAAQQAEWNAAALARAFAGLRSGSSHRTYEGEVRFQRILIGTRRRY